MVRGSGAGVQTSSGKLLPVNQCTGKRSFLSSNSRHIGFELNHKSPVYNFCKKIVYLNMNLNVLVVLIFFN